MNDPKQLILRAKAGDLQAYSALYELYLLPVYRYIYLRVSDRQKTEDLTQTVFLKVFESISRFNDQGKDPLAYFFTVARHVIIDNHRKNKNEPEDESFLERLPDEGKGPAGELHSKETASAIYNALAQLSSDKREAIVLKYLHDLSNEQISNIMGKREDAIRQLQSRGMKELREILRDII